MLVVCCVFSYTDDNDHHGSRRGNTARALARWQGLLASFEATVALHRAMLIVLYRPGGMVIEFTIKLGIFINIKYESVARK
jgi:hypothetical protein